MCRTDNQFSLCFGLKRHDNGLARCLTELERVYKHVEINSLMGALFS